MPYRFKVTKKKGVEYGQIVEYTYNSATKNTYSRSVESFGNMEIQRQQNPDIDKLIQAKIDKLNRDTNYSRHEQIEKLYKDIKLGSLYNNEDKSSITAVGYGIAAYRKMWEKLNLHHIFKRIKANSKKGISYDLDLHAFYLTALRILSPSSKRRAFEKKNSYIFDFSSMSLDNLYDCLTQIAARKDTIIKNLNKGIQSIYERVETIAFYDVTTFYFESFDSDELRARGMSKENKTNEVQVVLGLLVDSEGIPINYELFRGNTSEMKTIIEVVNKYRKENGLNKVTIVADRGLNSYLNLKELNALGFDYIVAQSISRLSSQQKDRVFDNKWDSIITDSDNNDIYKLKEIQITGANGEKARLIVTWSQSRAYHDIKVLNERYNKSQQLLQKGQGAVNASIKHGCMQFLVNKPGNKAEFQLNTKLYEKRINEAGYYALISSKTEQSPEDIYRDLRQLWRIEECFRVMKTNLNARPVYVWTTERIKGHFLICYLALVIERLSYLLIKRAKLNFSNHDTINILKNSNLAILQSKRSGLMIYGRLYFNKNKEEIQEMMEREDSVFKALGIDPLDKVETSIGLRKKFDLSMKI